MKAIQIMASRGISYLLFLSVLFFAACEDEVTTITQNEKSENGDIEFTIGFEGDNGAGLRVATASDFTSTWEDGDEIGLFAVKRSTGGGSAVLQPSGNYIHNVKLIYDNGVWTPATPLYWPGTDRLDFYAYYPYDALMADPTNYTFAVKADQRLEADYSLSDLLTASAADQAKGTAVNLQFAHALSLVQVEVKRGMSVPLFDDNFTVALTGALPSATLNLSSGPTASGTIAGIVMHKVDGMDYTYRALAPAQTLGADARITFIQTTTGSEIDMQYQGIASAVLTAAKAHKYSITLDWAIDPNHTYAVGDVYPYAGPAMGIVFQIDPASNGKHGKIVSLNEKNYVAWSTNVDNTFARNEVNGLENMKTIYALANDFSAYPAFNWVHEKNGGGSTNYYANTAATGVWYLPAFYELGNYTGGLYKVKTVVNTALSAVGGAPLSNDYYWTSSEYGSNQVRVINFNDGSSINGSKSGNNTVRCIMAF